MKTQITLSALDCPFQPQISEFVTSVEIHTNQWAENFNLYGKNVALYKSSLFGHMTCRFYPTASFERLCILNDLLTLLFVVDDVFDHVDTLKQSATPINLEKFVEKFTGIIMYGENATKRDGEVLNSLNDVWRRLKEKSSLELENKLIFDIQLLFKAISWQKYNVANGYLPTIIEFRKWRPLFGGAHLAASLIFFAQNTQTNLSKFLDGPLSDLTGRCGHLGCWANDILSFSKEKEHGDTHNLISILQKQYKLSIKSAEEKAIEIHNREMAEFHKLFQDLFKNGVERGYISDLSNILKGNLMWSEESSRYEIEYDLV